MGETIQEGGGHLGVAKDLHPFAEGQIGGDDEAGSFVKLADQMEEQGAPGFREGEIAQFIENDRIHLGQVPCQVAGTALGFLPLQLIDQIHHVVKAHPLACVDGSHPQGNGAVGLARPRPAYQDEVVGTFHEGPRGQWLNLGFL